MSQAAPAGPSADRNLLFGVLALQADLLDAARFAEACIAWSARKNTPLASLLVERGWLTPEDRDGVEQFLERKLKKHAGDVRASLAEVMSDPVRQTLTIVADPVLHQTLSAIAPEKSVHEKVTVNYQPAGRERYTLNRLHAQGGIGRVWLARDGDLGREVALKELLGGGAGNTAVVARFVEEAQITGQLQHPNIVPVYELARPADKSAGPFYTMRFVRGRTLTAAIKQYHEKRRTNESGPLELRALLGHFVAVCNAVAYAHSRGVLHRDLKPGNVVLGDFGEVIVLDWGLAKLKGAAESQTSLLPVSVSKEPSRDATVQGQAIGTPSYMPPEQAEGRMDLISERSDVYGLGAVLYEILTGDPPFDGPDTATILIQVVADEPAPPRRKVPATPPALEAVCLKALAKKPAERYASAKGLAQDVERWLGDERVTAWREPLLVRAGRWQRRHRQLLTGGAALLFAAVPLSLLLAANRQTALQQAEQSERVIREERDRAEADEQKAIAAAAAEMKAKETAEAREAETRAVLDFVENKVFAAARPNGRPGGLGPEVTLRRAVEAALPFVQQSFHEQPLIEARLRMTLGLSFWFLGEPRIAADQFQAARTIYTEHRGPDHPDMLASMNNLALSYSDLGRHAEALKLHERTLALRKAKLGPDHYDTLASMNNLANSYRAMGRHADALKLREETLALQKVKLGPDHPDTLGSMNNLVDSYLALGRHTEALKLGEETLVLSKAKVGPDHPDTLTSMHNLARSYSALGRYAEALKLKEETLALQKAALGHDHPSTLFTMNNLAASYRELGRYAESLSLHEETLKLRTAKFGPDHPDTLWSMEQVAVSYGLLGRYAEALKLNEATLALQKAKLGPDHPDTLQSMHNLAFCYRRLGRPREALKLNEETLALRKVKLGPDHPDTLHSMNTLAISYWDLGRNADAVKLLEEALALRKAILGPNHPDTMESMNNLAVGYDTVGRHDEALKLFEEAVTLQTAKLGPHHPTTAISVYNVACSRARMVAKSADQEKQANLAMEWLKKAVESGFKDVAQIKKDPDLTALRGRDDFKKLLAELEGQGEKGGKEKK
jgi:eukaryotic-like serine/threonine-protein kinase